MDSTTRIKDMPDYRGGTGLLAMDSKLYGTGRVSLEHLKEMMGGGPSDTEYESGTGVKVDNENHTISADLTVVQEKLVEGDGIVIDAETHEISIDEDIVATKEDLESKQDSLDFGYDGAERIVSIDGHEVGGPGVTVDTELSPSSNNPVANSTVYWGFHGITTIVYLNSYGNDRNDGLTKNTPVKTLAKALSIAKDNPNSLIYATEGGEFNLDGAEELGVAYEDDEKYAARIRVNILSAGYIVVRFKDGDTDVHINGNVSIVAENNLIVQGADIAGDRFYVESITGAVYVNDSPASVDGSSYTKYPGIRSKVISVKAAIGIFAQYLDINNQDGIAEFSTKSQHIRLDHSNIVIRRFAAIGQNVYKSGSGTEVYILQKNNLGITATDEVKFVCRDLYSGPAVLKCGKLDIKGHFIKTPCIASDGDVVIDSTYAVQLQGDIWSKSGNIVINAGSSYLQWDMTSFRSQNTDRYLKANGTIKITASNMQYSMSADLSQYGFEGANVIINLYGSNSSKLPNIYGDNVDINAASNDLEIQSIFPTLSSNLGNLNIRCRNLKFRNPGPQVGVSGTKYFKTINIDAVSFASQPSMNFAGYYVNIRTSGLLPNSSNGDFVLEYSAVISAMSLKLDCMRMRVHSGGQVRIGANGTANPNVVNLDWGENDLNGSNRYSAVINAASIRFTSTGDPILVMCPASGHVAGQYAILNAGVFDYSENNSAGGIYQTPVLFVRTASSIPFTGNIAGKVGAVFTGSRQLRCYDWDNKITIGFSNTASSSGNTSITAADTGTVSLAFSHAMLNEFYIAPHGTTLTSQDLHDGLSPETAVSTFTGLIGAMKRSGASGYPLKIHVIGKEPVTIDIAEIANVLHPCLFDIEGDNTSDVTVNINADASMGVIVNNMYSATIRVAPEFTSMLCTCDIVFSLKILGTGETAPVLNILSAECLNSNNGSVTISNVAARTMAVRSAGTIYYDSTSFVTGGSDIRLEGDEVKFNNNATATDVSQQIGSLNIRANQVLADLTKCPIERSSIKLVSSDSKGYGYQQSSGMMMYMDGRRGYYINDGITIVSNGYVDLRVRNSQEAAFSESIAPSGLTINAERLALTDADNTEGKKIQLPNMHCNFNVTEKIINMCKYVAIDYGIKRNTEGHPELVGSVYHDGSAIMTPRIETDVSLMGDSVIALLNGDYVVNVGMLDVCLELQSNNLYGAPLPVGCLVDINASLNINRIGAHGSIRGYHKYDSSHSDPIKFNIVANIGIVETGSAWYSYYNDGTAGEADNDPARHTQFKLIAHVMYEGQSSVVPSYTGPNTLWQIVCDDKTNITVDTELDPTSNNPVANSTLYNVIGDVETLLAAL